jgi:predicted Fe-Mo cluster-binding NifX family protein
MVVNTDCRTYDFIKSDAAGGKSVVELLSSQNCPDAIFSEIGSGALGHLKSVGIRGWMAPVDISGQQALEMFEHLRIKAAEMATEKSAGHSCCKQAGAAATSCCGTK